MAIAKKIICNENGKVFNSLIETSLWLQKSKKYKGKIYEGTKIAGKPTYRRLSLHLNNKPYIITHNGTKHFVRSIFGYTFKFK